MIPDAESTAAGCVQGANSRGTNSER